MPSPLAVPAVPEPAIPIGYGIRGVAADPLVAIQEAPMVLELGWWHRELEGRRRVPIGR